MAQTIGHADVVAWLSAYKAAWVTQNPDKVASLFTPDAEYVENPFDPAIKGREGIRAYWIEGAVTSQSDISFGSTLWALNEGIAFAHWQAKFTRIARGEVICLDGIFRLQFIKSEDNAIRCTKLEEWWFRDPA